MNLSEKVNSNKFTMSVSAQNIPWRMGKSSHTDHVNRMVTPERVIQVISALIGVKPFQLMDNCRRHKISHPRHIAMMVIRDECPTLSLPAIGRFFGMDHTSICHGIRRGRSHVAIGSEYARLYDQICQILEVEAKR